LSSLLYLYGVDDVSGLGWVCGFPIVYIPFLLTH